MLAEIFFLKLEAAIRAAEETGDEGRFVPHIPRVHNIDIAPNTKLRRRLVAEDVL
jgi:hypothetical protein